MSMTMSWETIREQMQNQRPARKRQLYEVAPSPPKKWRRFVAAGSPASSPSKGPLVDNDDDESPSFRAKSFYGRKKSFTARPSQSCSDEGENGSSVASEHSVASSSKNRAKNVTKTSLQRTHSAVKSSISLSDDEKITVMSPRVALSPIKNIYGNVRKGSKTKSKSKKAATTRKRRKSLPASVQPIVQARNPPAPPAVRPTSGDNTAVSATPPNNRKFFKHKSPSSASVALGGIIVGKGFNLKFVRGLLNKDFGQSPSKKRGLPLKQMSAPKVQKTYSRNVAKRAEEAGTRNKSALPVDDGRISSSSGHKPVENRSFQWTPDVPISTTSSPNVDSRASGEESGDPASQSLFSSDSQSLVSDMSGPTENGLLPNGSSQLHSASPSQDDSHDKFYSIFSPKRLATTTEGSLGKATADSPKDSTKRKFITARGDNKQLMLDVGQEKFGATQCYVCGMVYAPADAADETTHAKFHQSAIAALKFPGWKKERVLKEFWADGSRVISILPGDQRFMVKKVEEVSRVMGQELGFPDHTFSLHGSYKAFLYISDQKQVEGCCIAESISQGYRILPSSSKEVAESQRPWFSSSNPEPASLGIGRLWVYGPSRKKGIASRLLDCVRQWFEYGILIEKSKVAFSDPTPDGRKFAAKYTGTPTFLVYKYHH